jgi:hypothetical protein
MAGEIDIPHVYGKFFGNYCGDIIINSEFINSTDTDPYKI